MMLTLFVKYLRIIFWLSWVKEEDFAATSVSFHSNCEILRGFSSGLKTDCSCCVFSFTRSGPSPGTLFFIFHGFDVLLSLFPC